MPSWRTLKTYPDRLTAGDLWDERANKYLEVDVVIDSVRKTEVGFGDQRASSPAVLYQRHPQVPPKLHVINASMSKIIEGFIGNPDDYTKWPGTAVTIYVTDYKDKRTKITSKVLRYRPSPPRAARDEKRNPNEPTPEEIAEIQRREATEGRRG